MKKLTHDQKTVSVIAALALALCAIGCGEAAKQGAINAPVENNKAITDLYFTDGDCREDYNVAGTTKAAAGTAMFLCEGRNDSSAEITDIVLTASEACPDGFSQVKTRSLQAKRQAPVLRWRDHKEQFSLNDDIWEHLRFAYRAHTAEAVVAAAGNDAMHMCVARRVKVSPVAQATTPAPVNHIPKNLKNLL